METTKIPASKTIGEIQSLLAKSGAGRIMIDYNSDGEPCSLVFGVQYKSDQWLSYKLPARIDKLFSCLQAERAYPEKAIEKDLEQAKRVGWRQLLRWVQAQLALIEVGMADIKEVFLPYCCAGEKTMYQLFAEDHGIKLIEGATGKNKGEQ